ncbi:DUF3040 domain-containing protein [Naumannella cuiyingiana]|uniref:DUF3040 domain-containing protein n=1 Tax=Naumannella cuiyingiana TaxID=1347891 RepID=A0A7Z0DAS3_9ACTN|nr:hypothetical protein [Naumannella cuiyingiana]
MALSEEEQRLLDQMEAALAAEDPKLANAMRGSTQRRLHRRRATLAGIGFVAGLGMLIGGMEVHPVLSVAGFVLMLVATVVAISSWNGAGRVRSRGPEPSDPRKPMGARTDPGGRTRHRRAGESKNFMDRMEERWRRRQDEGF